jgi:hypothetical protein
VAAQVFTQLVARAGIGKGGDEYHIGYRSRGQDRRESGATRTARGSWSINEPVTDNN